MLIITMIKVKLMVLIHHTHKHHGKNERVEGCSGELKDIIKELSEKIKDLK